MTLQRLYGLVLLIGLLVTVYTLSNSSRFHVVDEVSLYAVTESMGMRGSVDTNAIAWTQWVNSPGEVLGAFGPEGDVYSKKGVGPAALALPWFLLLRLIAGLQISLGLVQGTLLWNGLVTALTAALVWLAAVRLDYDDRTGAALGLLFGLATIAWPYANQFFGEPLSAFGLMLAFYGLLTWSRTHKNQWALVAGAGAGLVLLTVTAHVILVAVLGFYGVATGVLGKSDAAGDDSGRIAAERSRSPADANRRYRTAVGMGLFAIPIVLAGALLMWYNSTRFGSPFNTGYHFSEGEGFTTPILEGMYGLLLSPYRGVFWFTPLFIASIVAFAPFARKHRLEAAVIGALSLALIVMYSMWWMWWAGFAWGPRFLVPLAPFWTLLLAPFVLSLDTRVSDAWRHRRGRWRPMLAVPGLMGWLFVALVCVSLLVQIAAVTVNFVNYEILLRSIFETDWSDPLAFGPPAQSLGDLLHSPVFGQFRLMQQGLVVNTDLAWLWQDGNLQMLVLLVGGAVLMTLLAMFLGWWISAKDPDAQLPSQPVRWLAVILPLLLVMVWTTEVSRHPHYGDAEIGYRGIIAEICAQAKPGDAVITVAPYAYQIPMNWMGAQCTYAPAIYGYAPESLEHAETQQVMARMLENDYRIWFVTGGIPPNDPDNLLERWLAETSYKAADDWFEDFRLLAYATPLALDGVDVKEMNVPLIGSGTSQVTVLGSRMPELAKAGDAVPIEIHYRIEAPNEANLRWFVQMLTSDGYPVALLDTAPYDGYTPFSELAHQEELMERAGLMLDTELPAGTYQVIAGLYNPDASENARLRSPDGLDFVPLGTLIVRQ